MKTNFNILGTIIIGISGVRAWSGHNSSGLIIFIIGLLFLLAAFLSNDKTDKLIEEIHKKLIRKTQNGAPAKKERLVELDENQIQLLSIFMRTEKTHINESEIIELSQFGFHGTKHILHMLEEIKLIGARSYYDGTETEYYISDLGRAYAMKYKIV